MPNFQTLKRRISGALLKSGIDLKRASSTPFGVRWHVDIQFFPNGKELSTIIDVGANAGHVAVGLATRFPKSQIYSFEPVRSTFQELVRNTASYRQIEPICCALGSSRGVAKMTTDPLSETNTLVIESDSVSRNSLVEVKVDTLDSFCAERRIQRVNLLKVDTEGYEMNVMKGSEQLLGDKRVDFILAECEFFSRDGEPHGDFMEISKFLLPFGFHIVSFYTGGVDGLGWVWGDVLFRQVSGCTRGHVVCSPARRGG